MQVERATPSAPGAHVGGGDDAALVLELVKSLIAEVHPRATRTTVSLDRTFEEDLGLGSLELVELLVRAEDAFEVALPSRVLATMDTPGALLRAVRVAERGPAPAIRPTPSSEVPAIVSVPVDASTLVEALAWHADTSPGRVHVRLLSEEGSTEEVTYGELRQEATTVAAAVAARGIEPGDRVAIMLPTSRLYFSTFVGALLAGAVPVPIYPPARPSQLADHLRRHERILGNAGAGLLVTVPEAVPVGRALRANVESLRDVVVPDALTATGRAALPAPAASDVALLQYTSGSTGHPKGVVLTHDNLLANIRAMGEAAAVSGADTFVSWLPLYHDMGLIGAWLSSLYFGVPLVVMPPQMFLVRPSRWLWAINDSRATISAGPNFAYELCLSKIGDGELEGLDLSSWRLAFNGAEPVSAATIERFAERFAPYGLRREAIAPVYGLAESSVGLTFPPLGRAPLVTRIARDRFLRAGRAVDADPSDTGALRFVACGQPLPGHEVRVVDAAERELGDRHEGRIEFRGPSATSGYWHNALASRALIHGDWLDTGDLGYVADGDLYVTGRVKDVIIRAGRNVHPDELEEAIGDVPGIRKGCVAVFASADPEHGTEQLVVLAETRETDDAATDALRSAIVATTVDLLGTPPDDVVLAPPRTVLKTSSGKIRRAASREVYEAGMVGATSPAAWRQVARFRLRGLALSMRRMRRASAAVGFAWTALLLVAMVGVPTLVLLAVVPGWQRRRRIARRAVRLLARLTGTPVAVHGLHRLPTGSCVVVANHPSWLDGFALALALPSSFRFVAGEVFRRRVLSGFALRRVGVAFVERHDTRRGLADTDRLVALGRAGECLAIFPEGRLARAPGLRAFHMGAFVVAAQAGVPVVPVVIRGTRSMLRPGHAFARRGAIHITVCPAVHPKGTDWAAAVELQRVVRAAVLHHSGEPDLE